MTIYNRETQAINLHAQMFCKLNFPPAQRIGRDMKSVTIIIFTFLVIGNHLLEASEEKSQDSEEFDELNFADIVMDELYSLEDSLANRGLFTSKTWAAFPDFPASKINPFSYKFDNRKSKNEALAPKVSFFKTSSFSSSKSSNFNSVKTISNGGVTETQQDFVISGGESVQGRSLSSFYDGKNKPQVSFKENAEETKKMAEGTITKDNFDPNGDIRVAGNVGMYGSKINYQNEADLEKSNASINFQAGTLQGNKLRSESQPDVKLSYVDAKVSSGSPPTMDTITIFSGPNFSVRSPNFPSQFQGRRFKRSTGVDPIKRDLNIIGPIPSGFRGMQSSETTIDGIPFTDLQLPGAANNFGNEGRFRTRIRPDGSRFRERYDKLKVGIP